MLGRPAGLLVGVLEPLADAHAVGEQKRPSKRRRTAVRRGLGGRRGRLGGLDQQRGEQQLDQLQIEGEADQGGEPKLVVPDHPAAVDVGHDGQELGLFLAVGVVDVDPGRCHLTAEIPWRPGGQHGGIDGVTAHQVLGLSREGLRLGRERGGLRLGQQRPNGAKHLRFRGRGRSVAPTRAQRV